MKFFAIENRTRSAALALAVLIPGFMVSASDEPVTPSTAVMATAITKPSKERKLAFAAPGIVASVSVQDGDQIKKGQVLASQDTRQDEFA